MTLCNFPNFVVPGVDSDGLTNGLLIGLKKIDIKGNAKNKISILKLKGLTSVDTLSPDQQRKVKLLPNDRRHIKVSQDRF